MSSPKNTLNPASIPLSLYIHFPWCIKKCPYCDFNSHELNGEIDERRYLNALKIDLCNDLEKYPEIQNQRKLQSVFLGGGTPSLFSASILKELLEFITDKIATTASLEVTMEVNPGTIEHQKFDTCLQAGINRLSMGIQSFNDASLQTLGRIHSADEARGAIRQAQSAGFENINLDLMFGLPGQDISQLILETDEAISYDTHHLSFYQLTLEPNTLFHKYPPILPDDDQSMEMQKIIGTRVHHAGLDQYEVSAYSKQDHQCQHNLNYWRFGDYLGIGAGSHSKITTDSRIFRDWKVKLPNSFMARIEAKSTDSNIKSVDHDSVLFEFMLNGLRLKHGFSLGEFESRTGLHRDTAIQSLSKAIEQHLVFVENNRMGCTDYGYLFIDEILQLLLP